MEMTPDNLEIVKSYHKEIRDLKAERDHWLDRHTVAATALDAANTKLTQMVAWLEANQPDVFKRGI